MASNSRFRGNAGSNLASSDGLVGQGDILVQLWA